MIGLALSLIDGFESCMIGTASTLHSVEFRTEAKLAYISRSSPASTLPTLPQSRKRRSRLIRIISISVLLGLLGVAPISTWTNLILWCFTQISSRSSATLFQRICATIFPVCFDHIHHWRDSQIRYLLRPILFPSAHITCNLYNWTGMVSIV